jgi:hypothetical protein
MGLPLSYGRKEVLQSMLMIIARPVIDRQMLPQMSFTVVGGLVLIAADSMSSI